jgi:fumarate reductase flavoprotein subunit
MDSRATSKVIRLETDIVVIGGGGAGLAATVTAAEKGANVILLEKRRNPGGNTAMANGLFAVESPVQKRMGLDVSKDDFFKIAMSYSHWEINPRIVRTWINKTGDTIRWLEEKGVNFEMASTFYSGQVHPVYHVPKRNGPEIIDMLVKDFENRIIQFLPKTRVKRVLTAKEGNVIGVLAATKDKELRITAKSVIIATGGYGGNKELLKKYCPYYTKDLRYFGVPLRGDGLLMAMEIGANTEGLGALLAHAPYFSGPWHQAVVLSVVALEPYTIWVNKRGERFVDEGIPLAFLETANALYRQPDRVSYHLFDEKMKQSMIQKGVKEGVGEFFTNHLIPKTMLVDLEKQLQSEADKGLAKISHSWDDLARWIGVAPEILKNTIEEYNSSCDQGYDEIFAKDQQYLLPLRTPPYYGIKCIQAFLDTTGGIKINHHMQVLDHQDSPILGLYAAGVAAGGWESNTYCIMLSGSACSFAINSGRIAGESAANYVTGGQ